MSTLIVRTKGITELCRPTLHTYLAVLSTVCHGTGAAVGAQTVSASASVLAGLRVALVLLILAEFTVKTRMTTAGKFTDVIDARPVVEARAGRRKKKKTLL